MAIDRELCMCLSAPRTVYSIVCVCVCNRVREGDYTTPHHTVVKAFTVLSE